MSLTTSEEFQAVAEMMAADEKPTVVILRCCKPVTPAQFLALRDHLRVWHPDISEG